MQSNPVGWFEIYVQDLPRARAFYEKVFAGQLPSLEGTDEQMWAFPVQDNKSGAAGAAVRMAGCSSGGNSTMIHFSCEDCAVEARQAKDSGGQVFREKFSIGPYGFAALVTDTDGNMIGRLSMR
jgi:uncharacterized protein